MASSSAEALPGGYLERCLTSEVPCFNGLLIGRGTAGEEARIVKTADLRFNGLLIGRGTAGR